jgi:hypothetical protein
VPPRTGIATNRTKQLISWLPSFGWEVTVVTPRLPQGPRVDANIVETGMVDIRGFLRKMAPADRRTAPSMRATDCQKPAPSHASWIRRVGSALTSYPDRAIGWLPFGYNAVRRLLATRKYDVLLSSSLPVTSHFIATLALRGLRGTMWVADLRDLWSDHHTLVTTHLRRTCDSVLERLTLSRAEPLAEQLRNRFPSKRVVTITNAFDELEWRSIPFVSETQCTIVYAGQFLLGKRDPKLLFAAIRRLLDAGTIDTSSIRLKLYCPDYAWLGGMIAAFKLESVVQCMGMRPREEVLRAERSADALLIALWDTEAEIGMYTGKFFEYVGARRPILVIGGPLHSVLDPLLRDYNLGWRCRDEASLRHRIIELIRLRHSMGCPLDLPPPPDFLSSSRMALSFIQLFEALRTT